MGDNILGKTIQKARKSKGMRQKDLAALCGVATTQICRIEKGITEKPFLSTIKAIGIALQIDLREVLRESGYTDLDILQVCEQQYKNQISDAENWLNIRHLSSEDKILMKNMYQKISKLPQKDKAIIEIILK